jgi:predicted dehydrogenase
MRPISFAIIGGGWRAEFFLRITRALPERFRVTGVLIRNREKHADFQHRWDGVAVADSLDGLLASPRTPRFVIVSVPWSASPGCILACAERGVPVLCETPPAPDLAGLLRLHKLTEQGARVQVAEQYALQPLHAAWLAIAGSGRLGEPAQAQVSVAHGYHGIHLMRRLLGVDFEPVTIDARPFRAPLVQGPDRHGPPEKEIIGQDEQLLARFDFDNGKLGIFDFTGAQYFSWIRANRVLVRGERGELDGGGARWLHDFRTPISAPLVRHDAGHGTNLEGFHHKGYTLGAEWVYKNPVAPGRLADDEIAIADCIQRMDAYVDGGPSHADLRQASQDQYLSLLMGQSARTGKPAASERQPWM